MDRRAGLGVLLITLAGIIASPSTNGVRAQNTGPDAVDLKMIVRQVTQAIAAYEVEYGTIPSILPRKETRVLPTDDVTVGEPALDPFVPNSALFNVLRAIDETSNLGHGNNPRRISFFESGRGDAGVSRPGFGQAADNTPQKRGCFFDPWGNELRIRIDYDGSGTVETPSGAIVKGKAIVWSIGPDGKSGTQDDIKSWD
jgi:hypothetical protein